MEQKPLLTSIKEAARQIGVEYRQLLRAVNDGNIPHYRLGTGVRLVDVSEILQVMKFNTHTKGDSNV